MNIEEVKELQDECGWNHHPQDYVTLYDWTKEIGPSTIIETGTKIGFSGMIMLKACPSASLVTLDNLQDVGEGGWGECLPDDVIKVKGGAVEELPTLIEEHRPELVFLDDGHSYDIVSTNIEQCKDTSVRSIIVHDANVNSGVNRAVTDCGLEYELVESKHGIARITV